MFEDLMKDDLSNLDFFLLAPGFPPRYFHATLALRLHRMARLSDLLPLLPKACPIRCILEHDLSLGRRGVLGDALGRHTHGSTTYAHVDGRCRHEGGAPAQ